MLLHPTLFSVQRSCVPPWCLLPMEWSPTSWIWRHRLSTRPRPRTAVVKVTLWQVGAAWGRVVHLNREKENGVEQLPLVKVCKQTNKQTIIIWMNPESLISICCSCSCDVPQSPHAFQWTYCLLIPWTWLIRDWYHGNIQLQCWLWSKWRWDQNLWQWRVMEWNKHILCWSVFSVLNTLSNRLTPSPPLTFIILAVSQTA